MEGGVRDGVTPAPAQDAKFTGRAQLSGDSPKVHVPTGLGWLKFPDIAREGVRQPPASADRELSAISTGAADKPPETSRRLVCPMPASRSSFPANRPSSGRSSFRRFMIGTRRVLGNFCNGLNLAPAVGASRDSSHVCTSNGLAFTYPSKLHATTGYDNKIVQKHGLARTLKWSTHSRMSRIPTACGLQAAPI